MSCTPMSGRAWARRQSASSVLRDLERFRLDGELLAVAARTQWRCTACRRTWRGDLGGRALRAALARLGSGRESTAHAESGHGARDPVTFEQHVRVALDSLPAASGAGARECCRRVEDEHPEDPDLFGLYEGVPLPDRGDMAGSCRTGSRSSGCRSRRTSRIPASSSARSASPSCTSSATISGWTRTGSQSWDTNDRRSGRASCGWRSWRA